MNEWERWASREDYTVVYEARKVDGGYEVRDVEGQEVFATIGEEAFLRIYERRDEDERG